MSGKGSKRRKFTKQGNDAYSNNKFWEKKKMQEKSEKTSAPAKRMGDAYISYMEATFNYLIDEQSKGTLNEYELSILKSMLGRGNLVLKFVEEYTSGVALH